MNENNAIFQEIRVLRLRFFSKQNSTAANNSTAALSAVEAGNRPETSDIQKISQERAGLLA